jgi:hypothetical protein
MIGFFPDPYPDELLYSICARYSSRVQYGQVKSVTSELFGTKCATAVIELPCYLDHFISVLPSGHKYTVEQLIDNHTLLRFYSPFLTEERVKRLLDSITGLNDFPIYSCLTLYRSGIESPEWLRFCPKCASEDLENFGELYWHRLHQIPGVFVCPKHQLFLEISNVQVRNRHQPALFVPASEAIKIVPYSFIDLSNNTHKQMTQIANDAFWLLNQYKLVPGYNFLRDKYMINLLDRQLASWNNTVNITALAREFLNYYSDDLLNKLSCSIGGNKDTNWLINLIRNLGKNAANHPIHHLLLIQFLGLTASDFFQNDYSTSILKPFGDGPWPCLDPTSEHFRQLTINKYSITCENSAKKPIGKFRCACGFSYSRTAPDSSYNDKLSYFRCTPDSQSWETALRTFWADSSLSLCEIGRRLGVTGRTIKEHAVKLGLEFPRTGPRHQSKLTNHNLHFDTKKKKTFQEKQEQLRASWLEILEKHPQATQVFLKQKLHSVYSWLYKRDYQWFEAHLPPRNQGGARTLIDWSKRDQELSQAVSSAVTLIKNAPGRPERITIKAICAAINRPDLLNKKMRNKLPSTSKVMSVNIESYKDFAIRRLKWATESFQLLMVCPKRYQLLRRAGLASSTILEEPFFQEAIDIALEFLSKFK